MANSQHRCVFVGNIPYDATEEQLVKICEEVGPVVSFRLVIDRETGKPKGYGFCEYRDEETALSARRNLHGHDINGRQLRVDFAENDKNTDRSREQGRGGPGLPTNAVQDAFDLQAAMAAANVMAKVLGGAQTNSNISQNGIQSQPALGTDPLTLHLAKIPKGQLIEVLTELKAMVTQNKEQARQLLLAHPQLSKAVLQAHIMLKSVPPHMLQMPNPRPLPGSHVHPPVHGGVLTQQTPIQALSGLPPLAQNKVHHQYATPSQSQPSSSYPALLNPNQYAAPSLPLQPRFQTPMPVQHQVLQNSPLTGLPTAGHLQSLHPQQMVSLSNRVENQIATSASVLPYSGQNAAVAPVQPSIPILKPSSLIGPAILNNGTKDNDKPQQISHNPPWGRNIDHHPNMVSRLHENASFVSDKDQTGHPPKLLKMEDGRGALFTPADASLPAAVSQSVPLSGNQNFKAVAAEPQKQNQEILPGVDPALVEQVLNLTPEQLSSLPPEQQQQVIQLQQMLRHSS
uniref:cleavage stimulating factor 64 isoform X2 n=1 Tax=Erigeron canadensis TaxID=72917 RepID=UPI001CB8B514|nr:cleavage stimulating factor 64 isoform X2 [Erigeron canadensis]